MTEPPLVEGSESDSWSWSCGPYGATVRVYERRPGGAIYICIPDDSFASGYNVKSLGHRDREKAKEEALRAAKEVRGLADRVTIRRLNLAASPEARLRDMIAATLRLALSESEREVATEYEVAGWRADVVILRDRMPDHIIEVKVKEPKHGPGQLYRYGAMIDGAVALTLAVPRERATKRLRTLCERMGVQMMEL